MSVREPALKNPQASLRSNVNGGGQGSGSLFLQGSWAAQANPSSANHVMSCPFFRPWRSRALQAGPRGQAYISFLSHGNMCLVSAPQLPDLGPLLVLKPCPGAGASSRPARRLRQRLPGPIHITTWDQLASQEVDGSLGLTRDTASHGRRSVGSGGHVRGGAGGCSDHKLGVVSSRGALELCSRVPSGSGLALRREGLWCWPSAEEGGREDRWRHCPHQMQGPKVGVSHWFRFGCSPGSI